jgi:hypothetical protein
MYIYRMEPYGIKFTCVYHLVVMDVVAVVTAELFTVSCNVMIFLILTDGEILNLCSTSYT